MTEEQNVLDPEQLLKSPHSRAHFLKGTAALAATLGLAPAAASAASLKDLGQHAPAGAESPQTILNIAATAEAAAVTALYHVHLAVNRGRLNVNGIAVPVGTLVSVVRAALREEQDHLAFLMGAGAHPLYMSFTFPTPIFRQARQTLAFFETAETVFIAAYMAASREFARRRMDTLVQYSYQIGGTEAEHRTLMRAALGQYPPNNKSFETNLYGKVAGAANTLAGLGIFRPNMRYPGAAAVDRILSTSGNHDITAGVVQRRP